MFAGVPGCGASDAWYSAALDVEYWQACGEDITGGAVDIYKCFDQVIMMLAYNVLSTAGLPTLILRAYRSFLENLVIYSGLVGSLDNMRDTAEQNFFHDDHRTFDAAVVLESKAGFPLSAHLG